MTHSNSLVFKPKPFPIYGNSGVFANVLYVTLEDGLWIFPDFSNVYERLDQGISLCGNFLRVVLNFNFCSINL
jgi:hypothetical protein